MELPLYSMRSVVDPPWHLQTGKRCASAATVAGHDVFSNPKGGRSFWKSGGWQSLKL